MSVFVHPPVSFRPCVCVRACICRHPRTCIYQDVSLSLFVICKIKLNYFIPVCPSVRLFTVRVLGRPCVYTYTHSCRLKFKYISTRIYFLTSHALVHLRSSSPFGNCVRVRATCERLPSVRACGRACVRSSRVGRQMAPPPLLSRRKTKMATLSSLQDRIQGIGTRLQAENESNSRDRINTALNLDFTRSRPGSERKPKTRKWGFREGLIGGEGKGKGFPTEVLGVRFRSWGLFSLF